MQADDPYAGGPTDVEDLPAPPPAADPAIAARASILGRKPRLKEDTITVDDWAASDDNPDGLPGGEVLLVETDAGSRADILQNALVDGKLVLRVVYPDLVIACARHPKTRSLLFGPADRDSLLTQPGSVIEPIATRAAELCGMNGAQAAKDAAGNSAATPS